MSEEEKDDTTNAAVGRGQIRRHLCSFPERRGGRWQKERRALWSGGQAKNWTAHPAQPKLPVSSSRFAMLDAEPALQHFLRYFRLLAIAATWPRYRDASISYMTVDITRFAFRAPVYTVVSGLVAMLLLPVLLRIPLVPAQYRSYEKYRCHLYYSSNVPGMYEYLVVFFLHKASMYGIVFV